MDGRDMFNFFMIERHCRYIHVHQAAIHNEPY